MTHNRRLDAIEQALSDAYTKAGPLPLDDETRARLLDDLLAGRVEGDPESIARRQALALALLEQENGL